MKNSSYFYNNANYSDMLNYLYTAQNNSTTDLIDNDYSKKIMETVINFAENFGFQGNIWQKFLIYIIVESENSFSLSCEWNVDSSSTIYKLATEDCHFFFSLFNLDLKNIEKALNVPFTLLQSYRSSANNETARSILPVSVRNIVNRFSEELLDSTNINDFIYAFALFYHRHGVGIFGLFYAFRLDELEPLKGLLPISNTLSVSFSRLVGYDKQKKQLIENTDNFIAGRNANNVMLFGDSGTGKSTCIKAVLNQYSKEKLRMIEIYKHQFSYLPAILREIKHRNYRFIIYMDDLSFEEDEIEYKYLKAIIEGGLEVKPSNVLIYATSNRRHLIREQWKDRVDMEYEDVHRSDTLEEKLSLAYRFGLSIFFPSPNSKEFKDIVTQLALRNNIAMDSELLLEKAHRWEMNHGGLSGRTAQQFIDYIKGNEH